MKEIKDFKEFKRFVKYLYNSTKFSLFLKFKEFKEMREMLDKILKQKLENIKKELVAYKINPDDNSAIVDRKIEKFGYNTSQAFIIGSYYGAYQLIKGIIKKK